MIQTQTIDIEHVRKVLSNCPHYDQIVNYEYQYGDTLSKKLIDWYRELIFSANGDDEKQLMLINSLDRSLYLYIKDNKYKRGLRNIITDEELTFEDKNLIKGVIKKLIEFTSSYEKKEVLEFNKMLYDSKRLSDNLWFNWYWNDKIADNIDYIQLPNKDKQAP
jgi:hypothetical protein